MTELEALREEVAYLRSELGIVAQINEVMALAPLAKSEARIVLALYHAKGRVLPCQVLLSAQGSEASDEIIKVQISRARAKVANLGIEAVRGLGYRMTPDGRETVAAKLGGLAG